MILHVDMDAFFASIEQRDCPELQGKAVIVGGSKSGRGVVAAASYEARKFGIHSAMSGRRAAELCPDAIFVRSNHRHYSDVGQQVREILHRYTPVVQPLSCDEAFLDVTGTLPHFASVQAMAMEIKQTIKAELQLTASVGAAPLKFVAKIASDVQKPDGCVIVEHAAMQSFLDPLPISRLWGVGEVTDRKLQRLGVHTIGDLRRLPAASMQFLGNWGEKLHRLANCIDPRIVVTDRSAKQISHERTFSEDINDDEALLAVANFLCDQVCRRVRANHRAAKAVTLKYRTHDFRTFDRSATLGKSCWQLDQVWPSLVTLLQSQRKRCPGPVRLLGVGLSELTAPDAPRQLELFDEDQTELQHRLDRVTDGIAARLGERSIYRATAHNWASRKPSDS